MPPRALAMDYDGTIAEDGRVREPTLAALRRGRRAGLRLILVTGRVLDDLLAILSDAPVFDRIVVENGALLYDPRSRASRLLAPPPPSSLIDALAARGVPLSLGRSIVATEAVYADAVRATIRDLGIDWHLIFNKSSVMALPSGVTKATGLAAALAELHVSPEETVAVGDAENDQAFMRVCGRAVAVANALPAVKADANLVTRGAAGDGVRELIDGILASTFHP
jgi:hydroxymethylpyrimidine pyrophosphatase-like HAD family hydrolase